MNDEPILEDIIGGPFSDMEVTLFDKMGTLPWQSKEAPNLDLLLRLQYGSCRPSYLLKRLTGGEKLTTFNAHELAKIIREVNLLKWQKQYALLQLEYNPVENYNRLEETEDLSEGSATDNRVQDYEKSHERTSDVIANDITERSQKDVSTRSSENNEQLVRDMANTKSVTGELVTTDRTANNGVVKEYAYGLNASEGGDLSKRIVNELGPEVTSRVNDGTTTTLKDTGTDSTQNTGTTSGEVNIEARDQKDVTNNEVTNEIDKIQDNTENIRTTNDKTKRSSRVTGNIGVMSTQDMIRQERELWERKFFEDVLNDVSSMLISPVL